MSRYKTCFTGKRSRPYQRIINRFKLQNIYNRVSSLHPIIYCSYVELAFLGKSLVERKGMARTTIEKTTGKNKETDVNSSN